MKIKPRKNQFPRNIVHPVSVLKKASDYLEYDIHTFAAGIEIYFKSHDVEIRNAALDSLLFRARILISFFIFHSDKSTDVLAIDYFHDAKNAPYKPKKTKKLEIEFEKINKRLMHLTTEPMPRLRSKQRYNLKYIIPPIIKAFRNWLTLVPENRLQQPADEIRSHYGRHLLKIENLLHQLSA